MLSGLEAQTHFVCQQLAITGQNDAISLHGDQTFKTFDI
jgi:hypothetical protein